MLKLFGLDEEGKEVMFLGIMEIKNKHRTRIECLSSRELKSWTAMMVRDRQWSSSRVGCKVPNGV